MGDRPVVIELLIDPDDGKAPGFFVRPALLKMIPYVTEFNLGFLLSIVKTQI